MFHKIFHLKKGFKQAFFIRFDLKKPWKSLKNGLISRFFDNLTSSFLHFFNAIFVNKNAQKWLVG